ncbi:hypothetical protein [Thermofilum adornatum]|uniref:hypothetical protein n=1 Tax=Thermofilum adornatum TaxID=1365176 RepID=UPI0011E51CA1|nr:hypothetical protein [Thermofilum adornatum]
MEEAKTTWSGGKWSRIRVMLEFPLDSEAFLSLRVDDFKGKGVEITSSHVDGRLIYVVESTPDKFSLARSISNELLRLAKMLEAVGKRLKQVDGGPAGT